MYCTKCGSDLRDIDKFCGQCGHSINSVLEAGPAPGARLSRPMADKKLAGVCAGFARYFDCDVTLMRVIWLVLAFGTGLGFIGYIVAWIAMPKDYGEMAPKQLVAARQ